MTVKDILKAAVLSLPAVACAQPVDTIITESRAVSKPSILRPLKGGYYQLGDIFCHESVKLLPSGSIPGIQCLSGSGLKPGEKGMAGTWIIDATTYGHVGPGLWRTKDAHEIQFYLSPSP